MDANIKIPRLADIPRCHRYVQKERGRGVRLKLWLLCKENRRYCHTGQHFEAENQRENVLERERKDPEKGR